MDKLVNYEKLSEFKDNLLNDSVASPKATWSSKKITTHLNTELANYATTASVDASLATKADVYEVASLEEIESLFIPVPVQQPDEIWYTSSDGNIITPTTPASLPTIVSNTYSDGKGIIKFASNLTNIGSKAFNGRNKLATFTLPNGVTTIGSQAFRQTLSSHLTSLVIPNSVTTIEGSAFYGCQGVQVLTIGSGVTSIGNSAFNFLPYLTTINFTGTMAQWNAITKGSGWIDTRSIAPGVTPPSVVHCSDGDVNL